MLTQRFWFLALVVCCLTAHTQEREAVRAAVAPKYPPLAVSSRISGDVTVRCVVDNTGEVGKVEALDGHPLLKIAAVEAARRWRFEKSSAGSHVALAKFEFRLLPEGVQSDSETTFFPPNAVRLELRPVKPPVSYGK